MQKTIDDVGKKLMGCGCLLGLLALGLFVIGMLLSIATH